MQFSPKPLQLKVKAKQQQTTTNQKWSISNEEQGLLTVSYREYYSLLIARAQMVGRLLLNKHLDLRIEINNLQKKKFLRIIKWYTW